MNNRKFSVYSIARLGILSAAALILSWFEAQIPTFFAVPGIKLGLSNLLVLVAMYKMSYADALLVNIVRILAVGVLFGNGVSIMYSLAGGILSFAVMALLKKTGKFSVFTVSIVGGIFHNIGQILMAVILIDIKAMYYLPVLWVSGIAAGAVIGLICAECMKYLPDRIFRKK